MSDSRDTKGKKEQADRAAVLSESDKRLLNFLKGKVKINFISKNKC